jgi:KaiC/GvpD/RAD55 family RecA-like ATPase
VGLTEYVSTGVPDLDNILAGGGYPRRSTILIIGPPSIGKEALGYAFIQSGLGSREVCLHATRLSAREVAQDQKAYRLESRIPDGLPYLLAREGGQARFDVKDPEGFIANMRELLKNNGGQRIRVFIDFLSSILILNSLEAGYRLVDELLTETKKHDVVLVATLEEGMHSQQVLTAMQQIFDGFIELSLNRVGLAVFPFLRIGKMRGMSPQGGSYSFSFGKNGISLNQAGYDIPAMTNLQMETNLSMQDSLESATGFKEPEAFLVFNYLVKSFVDDYMFSRLPLDRSGWRSRIKIVDSANVTQISLYARKGRQAPVLKELLSRGLVETRFFPRERGRGGEVVKIRIAYEREPIKRTVDRAVLNQNRV